jgi:hypothetical protein
MISERQAEALLQACERATGRPLERLRERIANQEKTLSSLWELMVLYCSLPLGSVEHEQEEKSRPDVRVATSRKHALWIEAAYIYSRAKPRRDDVADFVKWVLRELKGQGVEDACQREVEVLIGDASRPFETPKENERSQLLRSPSWREFCQGARESHCTTCRWTCPSGNVAIEIKRPSRSGTTILMPSFSRSRSPTDHPVYKVIAGKAEQAKKWHRTGHSYQPLVLCVGAEDPWEIYDSGSGETLLRRAVLSAFLNVRGMSLATQANITGRLDGKGFQVGASRYISAVAVVTLETRLEPCSVSRIRRHARSILFTNPQAESPLTREQVGLLEQLNFNSVEWGPGWEAWQAPRGSKRADNKIISRIRRQGGSVTMRSVSGGALGIEIPVHTLARLLAGDITHDDMEATYGKDFSNRLKLALERGEEIIGCEYIPADETSRRYDRILFCFAPPKPPVISDPDKRGGRSADARGWFDRPAFRWLSALCKYARHRSSRHT